MPEPILFHPKPQLSEADQAAADHVARLCAEMGIASPLEPPGHHDCSFTHTPKVKSHG